MATRSKTHPIIKHPFLTLLMFIAAYFTTVSINANAQDTLVTGDAIQLQANQKALITGTITKVNDDNFEMSSNGKTLRIFLKDVEMAGAADTVFQPGMNVSVQGDMKGENFGMMEVRAKSIVASKDPTSTYIEHGTSNSVIQ